MAEINKKIIRLAKQYTPTWSIGAAEDAGTVLAELFSEQIETNMILFKEMLKRHYIFYLNMYDISLKPSHYAAGYITFEVSTAEGVSVKKGTRVGNSEGIVYETCEEFCAVKPDIKKIIYSDNDYLSNVSIGDGVTFFDDTKENQQRRSIILSKENILDFKAEGTIKIRFFDTSKKSVNSIYPQLEMNNMNITWEYLTDDGAESIDNVIFRDNVFVLKTEKKLPLTQYNGTSAIWLRCTLKDNLQFTRISRNLITVTTDNSGLVPDSIYFNDTEQTKNEFMAFGEQFNVYDCMYLCSNECFSKAGSIVTLSMDIEYRECEVFNEEFKNIVWKNVMQSNRFDEKPAHKIFVERVIWEYWNEKGWSRIYQDDEYSDIFSQGNAGHIDIRFRCPDDMGQVYVGADSGLHIRCRILKATQGYFSKFIHISPVIKNLRLSYDYMGMQMNPDIMYAEHNMISVMINDKTLYTPEYMSDEYQTMYICFNEALPSGMIKILFIPENGDEGEYRWEGLVTDGLGRKWEELNVIDETQGFLQEGTVSVYLNCVMAEKSMFGESGYWIRLISLNRRSEPIRFKKVLFNTVRIQQLEKHEEEMFSVLPIENNKFCQLSSENVFSADVMVRENTTSDTWTKWGEGRRSYNINCGSGTIEFGGDNDRMVPPSDGEPTIRINYLTTSGDKGNQPENSITQLLDAVPFVDKLYNPESTYGGHDVESIESALRRADEKKVCLDRCISAEDFECFARGYNESIIRAKCFKENSNICLIILADEARNGSDELIEELRNAVTERMPFYMKKSLRVEYADYVKICINCRLIVKEITDCQSLLEQIKETLSEFLNPVRGNAAGKGYDIGEFPSPTKIFEQLRRCNPKAVIKDFKVSYLITEKYSEKELCFEEMQQYISFVPCNGYHSLTIEEV